MQGKEAYRLMHPALSSVLFLSEPAPRPGRCSPSQGPTLVLDQSADQEQLAGRGWAAHPSFGRYLVFPGHLLHGVLPGA